MRLQQLKISNFRAFKDEHSLDLDADVVLLYGANGAGKSSLLAALECAFTEAVAALRRYDEDYPRCLIHTDSDEAEVELAWSDRDGKDTLRRVVLIPRRGKPGLKEGPRLPSDLQRFFRERAFLSQTQLARLLDVYQQLDQSTRQQPLTRFIRELLSLDAAVALEAGLHSVAGDRRRLKKRSPAFQKACEEQEELESQATDLNREQKRISARVTIARGELAAAMASASLEPAAQDADPSRVRNQVKIKREKLVVLRSDLEKRKLTVDSAVDDLLEIEKDLGELQQEDVPDRHALTAELRKLEAQRSQLEGELGRGVEKLLQRVPDLDHLRRGRSVQEGTVFWSPELTSLRTELERLQKRLIARRERTEALRRQMGERRSELEAMILVARAEEMPEESPEVSPEELARLLASIIPFVRDDQCPVCRRDYAEVGQGSLVGAIHQQINRLLTPA